MKGDYRLLYGIWKKYGEAEQEPEAEENAPPVPPKSMSRMPKPMEDLLDCVGEA